MPDNDKDILASEVAKVGGEMTLHFKNGSKLRATIVAVDGDVPDLAPFPDATRESWVRRIDSLTSERDELRKELSIAKGERGKAVSALVANGKELAELGAKYDNKCCDCEPLDDADHAHAAAEKRAEKADADLATMTEHYSKQQARMTELEKARDALTVEVGKLQAGQAELEQYRKTAMGWQVKYDQRTEAYRKLAATAEMERDNLEIDLLDCETILARGIACSYTDCGSCRSPTEPLMDGEKYLKQHGWEDGIPPQPLREFVTKHRQEKAGAEKGVVALIKAFDLNVDEYFRESMPCEECPKVAQCGPDVDDSEPCRTFAETEARNEARELATKVLERMKP